MLMHYNNREQPTEKGGSVNAGNYKRIIYVATANPDQFRDDLCLFLNTQDFIALLNITLDIESLSH